MPKMFRLLTLLLLPLLLAIPVSLIGTTDPNTLAFFRATEDKAAYSKNPVKYDHVILREPTGKRAYYIERKPTHIIPREAVESVIVRKTKIYGSSDEETLKALQETLESMSKTTRKRQLEYPRGFSFNITFKIKPPESKKFSVFTKTNMGGFFQSRIGKRSVALVQFALPIEPDKSGSLEFTIYMQEDDADKVREMLSPFKDKVVWEE